MDLNSFEELGIGARLSRVLGKMNITTPTEIQSKALPPALAGRDVLASAETGSGKTAAFLLPIIERLKKPSRSARALVLAPTRELAIQIQTNAQIYGQGAGIRS